MLLSLSSLSLPLSPKIKEELQNDLAKNCDRTILGEGMDRESNNTVLMRDDA